MEQPITADMFIKKVDELIKSNKEEPTPIVEHYFNSIKRAINKGLKEAYNKLEKQLNTHHFFRKSINKIFENTKMDEKRICSVVVNREIHNHLDAYQFSTLEHQLEEYIESLGFDNYKISVNMFSTDLFIEIYLSIPDEE